MKIRRPRKPSIIVAAQETFAAITGALTRVGRTAVITVLHD